MLEQKLFQSKPRSSFGYCIPIYVDNPLNTSSADQPKSYDSLTIIFGEDKSLGHVSTLKKNAFAHNTLYIFENPRVSPVIENCLQKLHEWGRIACCPRAQIFRIKCTLVASGLGCCPFEECQQRQAAYCEPLHLCNDSTRKLEFQN